ncbi:Ribonuclease S-1, partial [Linum grandiflorum]
IHLLLLVLVLLVEFGSSVDYYTLALQWPRGVCTNTLFRPCRPVLPRTFTIHGYWPSNRIGPLPEVSQTFSHPMFLIRNITCYNGLALLNQMPSAWPQLFNFQGDSDFWNYEWTKHGRFSPLLPKQYFQEAVNIYSSLNILNLLQVAGVVPHSTRTNSPVIIQNALGLGYYAHLLCYKNP